MTVSTAWAKLDASGGVLGVCDHGEDVAAVFRALAGAECFGRGLQDAAGRALTEQDVARLSVLVFVHDMGKCNAGFWARQHDGARRVGHTEQLRTMWSRATSAELRALQDAIFGDWEAAAHFAAVMAHHGRPLEFTCTGGTDLLSDDAERQEWQRLWGAREGYDPEAELERVIATARARCPAAFAPGAGLPQSPRFVHLFAGLVTLADWIGSDTARFCVGPPTGEDRVPYAARQAAEAVSELGLTRRDWSGGGIEEVLGVPTPWESQRRAGDTGLGQIVVLEAETGSGKTEAALWRFLTLARSGQVDALYFALPTRTAAVQLHARLTRFFRDAVRTAAPEPVLAVPGYLRAGDTDGTLLAPFDVLWPDEGGTPDARWAAQNPKRYLAARVAVGTVDQALLAGVCAKHAHLRAAALSRSLLVVDEVHASDPYMAELLQTVVSNHVAVGGHVLLLSATLGGEFRAALTGTAPPTLSEAVAVEYPALSGSCAAPVKVAASPREKDVSVTLSPIMSDPDRIAAQAVAAARQGASVLVLRNLVDDAVAVARAVQARGGPLFTCADVPTLHHGRFAPEDRRRLDARVEAVFGKQRQARYPVVLCGTQTLEQSLDIDADFLLTDLAPMDVLLQRLGRLHRHDEPRPAGFTDTRAIVLTPAERDLKKLARHPRHGLGRRRDRPGVYPDLAGIEATWGVLEDTPQFKVPRDCRCLVERSQHSQARAAAARRAGLETEKDDQHARTLCDVQQARAARLDMATPFESLMFPGALEGAVSTRLGAADLLIDLPDETMGPFGRPISRLRLPAWMSSGIDPDDIPVIEPQEEGLRVSIGSARFLYDRFGLQSEK